MNVLCIVAHPDDELGCGGTLARLKEEGHDVSVRYFTDGVGARGSKHYLEQRAERQRESVQAARALGLVDGITARVGHVFGAFKDNEIDDAPLLGVARAVEDAIAALDPEVIYTHTPTCLNQDHVAVAKAVVIATRPVPGQTVKAVYGFEVPSSTEWAFGAPPFAPNVFQPLTDDQMERKRQALRCYASELRDFPHPRSIEAVDALARYRGSQCGHPWAEAFQLLREVR